MKRIALMIITLQLGFSGFTQNSIAGDWNGLLEVQGTKLRLAFHIQKEGETLTATMDSPDQGAFDIPVQEIQFDDPVLSIKMSNLGLTYTGKVNAKFDQIEGNFQQAGLNMPLKLQREAIEKPIVNRPQNPTEPYPYYTEEVTFDNAGADLQLAGTLSLPAKEGTYPVVILISGSGPQDRNEELLGHKPFLVLADHLTRQGIGVLRFDDRGVGSSTGDFATATSKDFATDVLAGVEYLKTRPEVKKDQIGLIGHSEGGLIAPMVAVQSKDVAYMVLLAGPGVPGADILLLQQRLIAEAGGESEAVIKTSEKLLLAVMDELEKSEDIEKSREELRGIYKEELNKLPAKDQEKMGDLDAFIDQQLKALTSPWFRYFLQYDPKESLENVQCPVLALNGEKDLQVDPGQNLPPIEAALKKAGNQQYQIKELEGLNHLFQTSKTGSPSEYATIEETFAPSALEEVSKWIKEVVK